MSHSTVLFDAPGPRAIRRNRALSVLTLVVLVGVGLLVAVKLADKGQFEAAKWQPFLTPELWETYLLPGIQGTLTAAVVSIVFAMALGLLLAVGRMSASAPLRWLAGTVVEFFRAVPVLVMMIFTYYLYAQLDAFPSSQLPLAGVITGLTLYNSAVIAEIVRAGVASLPRGQAEAAAALGLRWSQTMRLILLPQALTAMLPALVSQLVVVLKDTAIGYQINFLELVRQGQNVGTAYRNLFVALVVVAVLMIALNFALSWLAGWLERRLRRSPRSAAAPVAPRGVQIDTPAA
ncbi:amino acid ABC transporter permease [Mycobacterium sp. MYCO198283]|uniref:amino acid ABC transporter permease n=1 Tax=Mycobacterium sp. MYCO198283 TaxID=2883505 RepID=UPI001E47B461|nr:amino acid ABC transporter permease [Mycobacterium sp. MYCO198283]MCG5433853.1 amino acid ABC transporter permease [Mycobacterium sp. MYCO198283]